tara:strand:- start:2612 stop:3076 length:465 start_codon:yes stop_codon:yes gene_type:complete
MFQRHGQTFDSTELWQKKGREIVRIFVGALSYELKEDELKAAFETYGKVESATIIVDRDSGRSKGFGFVEMPEKEEALKAIEGLNGTDLGGKTITVNEARPKSKGKRPGGYVGQRSGYGGGRGGGPGGGPGGGKKRGDFGGSRRDRPGGGRGNR